MCLTGVKEYEKFKCVANHVMKRDVSFISCKRVPYDVNSYYSIQRLCFSLKTKSNSSALRYSKSLTQRLDDYWFGIRLRRWMFLL